MPAGPTRWLSRLAPFTILAAIPLTFLAVSRGGWLIDAGGADNWSYVKYLYDWGHASDQLKLAIEGDYKASRLPWIAPGYLFFLLFGGVSGSYLLHLTVLLITILAFYYGLLRLFDPVSALLTSSIVLIFPGFHASGISGFWYYHEQAAAMYYALACLGIVMARASPRPWCWHALTGFGLTSSVLTSLTYVLFLPAIGLFFLLLHRRWSLGRLLRAAGIVLGSGVLTVVGYGLLSVLAGGRFWFVAPQVAHTLRSAAEGGLTLPLGAWLPRATWLAFPLAVVLGLPLALAASWPRSRSDCPGRPDRDRRDGLLACGAHLYLAAAVLLAAEARGQPVLQVPYIVHQLFGPGAYGLGAILSALRWRVEGGMSWRIGVAVTVGALPPVLLLGGEHRAEIRSWLGVAALGGLPGTPLWGLTALLLVGGLATIAAQRSGRLVAVVPAGLVLGVGLAAASPPGEPYLPPPACDARMAEFRLVHRAARWASEDPRSVGAAFWYAPDEQAARAGGAQASGGQSCPPLPLRRVYVATAQAALLQTLPPAAPAAGAPEPALPDPRALDPDRRAWRWAVVGSTPENAPAARARFEAWLTASPIPVPWRYAEAVSLREGDIAITLSLYALPWPPE